MESEKMPADWTVKRVLQEVKKIDPSYNISNIMDTNMGKSFARYIEAHEKPPVDRKLLCAREAIARINEKRGNTTLAASIRAGEFDHEQGDMIDAITLWEQGFAK